MANRYVIISAEEHALLQRYRLQLEVERVQRVLAYWQLNWRK